jgi:hypothetical protein
VTRNEEKKIWGPIKIKTAPVVLVWNSFSDYAVLIEEMILKP